MTERAVPSPPLALPVSGLVLAGMIGLLALSALQAYTLASIPIEWIGRGLTVAVVALLWLYRDLYAAPGAMPLLAILAWGVLVTVANALTTDYFALLPAFSTTSYPVFIVLRWLWALSFVATLLLVYWVCAEGGEGGFVRWLVHLAAIVAIVAIYIYFAQRNGWWEPPRNRVGTGLAVGVTHQGTGFVGYFHRAMGTFREPSHLAAWLVLPLCLAVVRTGWLARLEAALIAVAVVLSVSLGAILSLVFGFLGALVVCNPLAGRNLKLIGIIVLTGAVSVMCFELFAIAYGTKTTLFAALWERIEPLAQGGLSASNRAGGRLRYVDAFGLVPPIFGYGWGHTSLLMAERGGYLAVPTSHSFFLYNLASIGVVGLAAWIGVLVAPAVRVFLRPRLRRDRLVFALMVAYLAHVVMLTVYSEEPHFFLAVTMALLGFLVWRHDRASPCAS